MHFPCSLQGTWFNNNNNIAQTKFFLLDLRKKHKQEHSNGDFKCCKGYMEKFACYLSYPFPIPSCCCSASQGITTPKILCQLPPRWVHPMRGTRTREKRRRQSTYSSLILPWAVSPLWQRSFTNPRALLSTACQGSPAQGLIAVWRLPLRGCDDNPFSCRLFKLLLIPGGFHTWVALSAFASPMQWIFCIVKSLLLKNTEQALFSRLDTDKHKQGDDVSSYLHLGWMI